jgi:hypothetical protein
MVRVDYLVEMDSTAMNDSVGNVFSSQKVIDASAFFTSRYFQVCTMILNQVITQPMLQNELTKTFVIVWVS